MTVKEEFLKLTSRQKQGRAINAVAELLRRMLSVPNIYLEPPHSLIPADILAVDRGGAGDLHAVEVNMEHDLTFFQGKRKSPSSRKELNEQHKAWYQNYCENLREIHHRVMSIRSHYRYLAIPEESLVSAFGELTHFGLFSEDGMGRLGVITFKEKGETSPTAKLEVPAERFRMDPSKLRAIEVKLLAKSRPDIEVRI